MQKAINRIKCRYITYPEDSSAPIYQIFSRKETLLFKKVIHTYRKTLSPSSPVIFMFILLQIHSRSQALVKLQCGAKVV